MLWCVAALARSQAGNALPPPPGATRHKPIAVHHPALGEHTFAWLQVYFYMNT